MIDIKTKLTSRKFWLCVAAFLASIGTSIAGIQSGNATIATTGTVCTIISAAIYAAAEAAVDVARVSNETPQDASGDAAETEGKAHA